MPKPKKFTIRIFENRSLKEKEAMSGPYFPLYLNLSFQGKNKTIKSLSFELLDEINSRTDLLIDGHNEIEKNDKRILEGYRNFVESQGREFSINLISPENEEYQHFKTPVFFLVREKVISQLFSFFHGVGPKSKHPFSQLLLAENQNWVYFIYHLKEVSPQLYSNFLKEYPETEKILLEIIKLENLNIFPYIIDFQYDNSLFNSLKFLLNPNE